MISAEEFVQFVAVNLKILEPKFSHNTEWHVELRFPNHDFEVIDALRADELVDQKLTPQTRASI